MTDMVDDFASICTFCSEVEGNDGLNLFFELGIPRAEYILYETEHWVVFPCIGALTDWYVLIVSKKHVLSVGWLDDEERDDLRLVVEVVKRELRSRSGLDTILFEHGSYNFRSKRGGACFDHAHVHAVATNLDVEDFLVHIPKSVDLVACDDWADRAAKMVREDHQAYLALQTPDNQMVGVAKEVPSQFFRRALASWLGAQAGDWDWYINRQEGRVRAMTTEKWISDS